MATKGERQALLFLAVVAMLGAANRVYRSRHVTADAADLDRQIGSVDSLRGGTRKPPKPGHKRSRSIRPRDSMPDTARQSPEAVERTPPSAPVQVDLDTATAGDIERLPGIGPALAKRIVTDRDSNGAFGCLKALDAVRGIGPAMLKRLDSLVTFSGRPRTGCPTSGRP